MPEPLEIKPPNMFLVAPLVTWPLADNGFPPIKALTYAVLTGVSLQLLGLPSDRARFFAAPKELCHVSNK